MIHFFHKWNVAAIEETKRKIMPSPYLWEINVPEEWEECTLILEVCTKCGTSRTRSLPGSWTMHQLNGGANAHDRLD